jgi:hypoxanthine phosphoribosyltransferase
VVTIVEGLLLGIVSSLAAAWIIYLRGRARLRLRFRNILSFIAKVVKQVELDNFSPQYIVTVDRNSGVVGSILAGHIGLRAVVSVACEHHRLTDGTRDTRLDDVSKRTLSLLRGSRLLVLICCNDSGTSLKTVVDYLQSLGHDPEKIRTAAIYTSVSPSIVPRYSAVTVGLDTHKSMNQIISKLPWMTAGWHHVLGKERLNLDK